MQNRKPVAVRLVLLAAAGLALAFVAVRYVAPSAAVARLADWTDSKTVDTHKIGVVPAGRSRRLKRMDDLTARKAAVVSGVRDAIVR